VFINRNTFQRNIFIVFYKTAVLKLNKIMNLGVQIINITVGCTCTFDGRCNECPDNYDLEIP
jgi:hypothetical protein